MGAQIGEENVSDHFGSLFGYYNQFFIAVFICQGFKDIFSQWI